MTTLVLPGASGSGKTIAQAFASRSLPKVHVLHFDHIGVPPLQRMIAGHGLVKRCSAMTFQRMPKLSEASRQASHILIEA
jgi:hypothetical protein